MNESKLPDYLEHIRRAAAEASGFIQGISKLEFFADRRTQNAVVMCLVVIGEASTKVMDLYPDFTIAHTEIPWHKMRGMRNRIAHGYFEVDFEMVWDTITTALPELLLEIEGLPKQ